MQITNENLTTLIHATEDQVVYWEKFFQSDYMTMYGYKDLVIVVNAEGCKLSRNNKTIKMTKSQVKELLRLVKIIYGKERTDGKMY